MLQVELDHILPESDAYSRIREIFDHVEQEKEVYVVTKEGRPVVAIINVDQLETDVDDQQAVQTPMDALFGMNPAPTPIADQPASQAAPAPLPPLPEPPVTPQPEPATPPLPEPAPIAAQLPPIESGSGSPLDEPLPPLGGTEHLQPPMPPAAPMPPAPQQ